MISFDNAGILLEIAGFIFLIPTIQDKVWMYHNKNISEVKQLKSNYLDHFPFHIGINNLIEPYYSNYYNSKNHMSDAGILLVLLGLIIQFTIN